METQHVSVGLDIGTTKIVAMIGRRNDYGKLEILGIGRTKSLGVHRGVVNNITQTIQSIQQAVGEAEAEAGFKIEEVTVGIAGQHIRSLQHSDYITRPNSEVVIDEDDIDRLINQVYKLVMLPGEEIIHVLPQEFKVDGQAEIKEPIGMYGGRLEANFHVVVGQVSSIRNIGRCVKSAGLDLEGITLEPLASANAVLSQEEGVMSHPYNPTLEAPFFHPDRVYHTAVEYLKCALPVPCSAQCNCAFTLLRRQLCSWLAVHTHCHCVSDVVLPQPSIRLRMDVKCVNP